MIARPRVAELTTWGVLAFVAGFLPGWIDLRAVGVQGPVLVLMIVNFALTLPGRAPVLLVAFASWLAMPVAHAVVLHEFNALMVVAIVPALIAGGGGRIFGSLLDTAAAQLEPPTETTGPWYQSSALDTLSSRGLAHHHRRHWRVHPQRIDSAARTCGRPPIGRRWCG